LCVSNEVLISSVVDEPYCFGVSLGLENLGLPDASAFFMDARFSPSAVVLRGGCVVNGGDFFVLGFDYFVHRVLHIFRRSISFSSARTMSIPHDEVS